MIEPRRFIEELVPELAPNARVIAIDETDREYRVTIAGTTGVTATCELSREEVDAAELWRDARSRVAIALKGAADQTVAPVPDARA
jgi:hypothetical protein